MKSPTTNYSKENTHYSKESSRNDTASNGLQSNGALSKEPSSKDPTSKQDAQTLASLAVPLLKGVIYRENDERLWGQLLQLQARVRDYMTVLGLDLVLDEAEGYAFLRSRADNQDEDDNKMPRLIARCPLTFAVSLLLALLRKKLAETDAGGGDTRLVLSRDDIVDLVRVFMPDSSNEARLIDQIETHINKVVELGFLRRLKNASGQTH